MNTTAFPYRLKWTSEQIADAVPLRLFELVDAGVLDIGSEARNDARAERRREWRGGYCPQPALPAFVQVRH